MASEMGGSFHGAHNFEIHDSIFMDGINHNGEGLSEFYKLCDPAAIFDTDKRVSVTGATTFTDHQCLWLSGPLGMGKTTLAQTMVEEWAGKKRAIATFFFSPQVNSNSAPSSWTSWTRKVSENIGNESQIRPSDRTRERIPLVLTPSYQLARSIPDVKKHILSTIKRDPSILDAVLKKQFNEFILNPLRDLPSRHKPIIILIDALDECRDTQVQEDLLKFLITSRPERNISELMETISTAHPQHTTPQRTPETDPDIEIYMKKYLSQIRKNTGDSFQYDDRTITELVNRSCGQFIFASTVVQYVGDNKRNPSRQIDDIMKATTFGHRPNARPFQNLDTLYLNILVNSESDRHTLVYLLGWILATGGNVSLSQLDRLCYLHDGDSLTTLRPLQSLLQIPIIQSDASVHTETHVRIFHASFMEFLTDATRSRQYFINLPRIYSEMCAVELINRIEDLYINAIIPRPSTITTHDDRLFIIKENLQTLYHIEASMSPFYMVVMSVQQIMSMEFLGVVVRFWKTVISVNLEVLCIFPFNSREWRYILWMTLFGMIISYISLVCIGSILNNHFHFLQPWAKVIPVIMFLSPGGIAFFLSALYSSYIPPRITASIYAEVYVFVFLSPLTIFIFAYFHSIPIPIRNF
ncbi:hypothetical protein BDQ17DRAFT_1430128 [Cyathus striatus]|nr:hypothetical protein BDQ17DRAFT_1430128 [Cyathus striatus]